MVKNPFLTSGYAGPEYFCDRIEETARLSTLLRNGNNVVLMSPRRMGKTGLIHHLFEQEEIKKNYYCFIIDIYSTKNLNDLALAMGKSILNALKSKGRKAIDSFVNIVASLRAGISFDSFGMPSLNLEIGNITSPNTTLEQIFEYIEHADRPCIVAIDEFQQISYYPENNIEAVLRSYIQKCNNANFIFSGSERHLLSEMFHSPSRPFYASTSTMRLEAIDKNKYAEFAMSHFANNGRTVSADIINNVYEKFEGITWYLQKIMNCIFSLTSNGETCSPDIVDYAISEIMRDSSTVYVDLLYQLTSRQRELLMAISKEGKASAITSSKFIKRYALPSASTIQTSIKSLLEKQLITVYQNTYEIYDKFFGLWLTTM